MATNPVGRAAASVTTTPSDPEDWLSRVRAAGGWCLVGAGEKISIGWRLDEITGIHPANVRAIYGEVEHDTAKREALKAHLLADVGRRAMFDPNLEKLTVNGMKPFFRHSDGASEPIGEAHALLLILASAYLQHASPCRHG